MSETKKPNFIDNLVEGWKEGYDEQDKQIAADKSTDTEKVTDGFAGGTTEGIANPFNWLKSLIR